MNKLIRTKNWVAALLVLQLVAITAGCSASSIPQKDIKSSPGIPAKSEVKFGIDNIDAYVHVFAGKRVGLITNSTGVNKQYQSSVDVLFAKTRLTALFSPEHGLRGNVGAGDSVNSAKDRKTGLPVYSLYGATKKPTADMLKDVDVLVFDIQDIGTRFYTYIYTMAYAMQAAKEQGKTFVVLDRPNPVGGEIVEGNVLKAGFESFIGMYPITIRHGLTVGEMAKLMNEQFNIGCQLFVIPMTGWTRNMHFDDTGLPWVMTSPNIPTPDAALVYSGTGIFGGTNVSDGVGTTRPFELVGAPWLDADALADRMNGMGLPGVVFRPVYFTPRFGRYQDQTCAGVQLHVTDRKIFRAVKTGISLLYVIKDLGGDKFLFNEREKSKPMIDLLTGDAAVRNGTHTLEQLLVEWDKESQDFQAMTKKYYLY